MKLFLIIIDYVLSIASMLVGFGMFLGVLLEGFKPQEDMPILLLAFCLFFMGLRLAARTKSHIKPT